MDSPLLSPFERSLLATSLTFSPGSEEGAESDKERWAEVMECNRQLVETLLIRKQIDGFLGSAGKIDEIGALLLTIITEGHLFAYNRALLLLTDRQSGSIRGNAGIGALSKEEAWNHWAGILGEGLDLERLVGRAMRNFREQNQKLTPLLEKLDVPPGQVDRFADSFRGPNAALLTRSGYDADDGWLFNVLDTNEVGVVPLWGSGGHFGVLLVDNFASGRKIHLEGIQVLDSFVKPFASALERALIIEQYREKVVQLQEANARIEAQHEMLLRMERKNTVGRFTATLAHNLLNPVVSMSGNIVKMGRASGNGGVQARLIEALRKDVRDLEDFLADFISQVQEELPLRHFWDLNHLVREVIAYHRRFNNVVPPCITFEEEDVSLVRIDYEKVTSALCRLLGIAAFLMGGLDGLIISTATNGATVHLTLHQPGGFRVPTSESARVIDEELLRLKKFMAEEDIELALDSDRMALIFRI